MSFAEMGVGSFCGELASKAAVPGGGGASALAAALGAALSSMVGNLTIGKKEYAQYEEEMTALTERARALSEKLVALIDADAEAFAPLSACYALPKDDPERAERMEQALDRAAQVPLEILRCACEGIELHAAMEEKCSALAVSDVATGVVLCWAALYGAAVNVRVNTKSMTNRERAEELNREAEERMARYWTIADGVYERIWLRLS